ncbi:transcriptional regulator [Clostridia bacterium]|nr:transcriptional regulator [Clostridia bacterium]
MTGAEKIIQLANGFGGVITTRQVSGAGISKWSLFQLEKEKKLYKVGRGVYVTEDGWIDEFYLAQVRFPKGIFSHETALYLHGFSDRIPLTINMTFPYGTNVTPIKEAGIRPYVVRRNYDVGTVTVQTQTGHKVRAYSMERTLVDLVNPRYDGDIEQTVPAFQRFARSKNKDVNALMDYAKLFNASDKIRSYMEVLL